MFPVLHLDRLSQYAEPLPSLIVPIHPLERSGHRHRSLEFGSEWPVQVQAWGQGFVPSIGKAGAGGRGFPLHWVEHHLLEFGGVCPEGKITGTMSGVGVSVEGD